MLTIQKDALFARLEAGDREALGELWAHHRERLLRHVERKLERVPVMRRVIDPADVVQLIYFEAVRDLPNFLARAELVDAYVWLIGLARRGLGSQLETHLDAQKRCLRVQQAIPDDAHDFLVDESPEPSELAAANEMAAIVMATLDQLSSEDREVIRLARIEGRTLREVAGVLGISEDAVAQRLSRARRRLWAKLLETGISLPRR